MNKYKNSAGSYYTRGLFYETTLADKTTVVYTLKNEDHEGFPSLYRLYMETADPTEYRFAVANLGSWEHWEALCKASWFKPYVASWRRELEIWLKSEALAEIMALARSSGRDKFSANRFLIERGWEVKPSKGRPTQQAVDQAAYEIAQNKAQIEEDFQRITEGKIN